MEENCTPLGPRREPILPACCLLLDFAQNMTTTGLLQPPAAFASAPLFAGVASCGFTRCNPFMQVMKAGKRRTYSGDAGRATPPPPVPGCGKLGGIMMAPMLSFTISLAVYMKTMYPTVSGGDSGELMGVVCSGTSPNQPCSCSSQPPHVHHPKYAPSDLLRIAYDESTRVGGVAHPPGYPLWLLLATMWSWCLSFLPVPG